MTTFHVLGIPQPKGSTKSFRHPHTGRVVTLSDNDRLKGWERTVALCAKAAGLRPHDGPCCVRAEFVLPRPKGHSGARGLRPSAPGQHTVKADLDKLCRGLLDGLNGIAWVDDARVNRIDASKRWAREGEQAGAIVTVWQNAATAGGAE